MSEPSRDLLAELQEEQCLHGGALRRLDAAEARVVELTGDRDSWRRVAERLEREKVELTSVLREICEFTTGRAALLADEALVLAAAGEER